MPVGHVAKKDCEEPELGDAHCVLASLTEKIVKWNNLWDKAHGDNHGFIKLSVRSILRNISRNSFSGKDGSCQFFRGDI